MSKYVLCMAELHYLKLCHACLIFNHSWRERKEKLKSKWQLTKFNLFTFIHEWFFKKHFYIYVYYLVTVIINFTQLCISFRGSGEMSTRDLQKMVQALPQYSEQIDKLSLHVEVSSAMES